MKIELFTKGGGGGGVGVGGGGWGGGGGVERAPTRTMKLEVSRLVTARFVFW